MTSLSVIILTFNEELNLPACLESLKGLSADLFVVDSGSTDRTADIARAAGATVVVHPFEDHARQWRWALSNLPLRTDWVLGLDADQRLTARLSRDMDDFLRTPARSNRFAGAYLNRRQIFRGRWIRHGGYYPKYLLKLFRRDTVSIDENDLVDHHFIVNGKTCRLAGDILEDNLKERDLGVWIGKHVGYARRQAEDEFRKQHGAPSAISPRVFGNSDERVAFRKGLWRKLPLYVRPFLYFHYRYFVRLGFLDGAEGFQFHFLQGFWYRMLVDSYLRDLRRSAAS